MLSLAGGIPRFTRLEKMITCLSRIATAAALGTLVILVFLGLFHDARAQQTGEQLFQTTCAPCHTIGGGRRVGPDVAGVNERRSQEWLEQFVKSSQSMIKSGDAEAVALSSEYAGIVMPDAPFSGQQIRDVLAYIESESSKLAGAGGGTTVAASGPAETAAPASEEDIAAGQGLFQGNIRLANHGPACNACHDVRHDAVIGGGILAAELTTVFSRLGGTGVKAILGQAPFPVMQAAYQDKPLTEGEIAALVSFLQFADSEQYNQLPRDYGIGLFISGLIGVAILLALFSFIWRGRKTGSVNQEIYDRQVKSSWE
jgi:mono/diheme cytochrome c family protein